MSETIRAFIAIELDEPVRTALQEIQDELKTSKADAKWVNPHNIHLTLKFLGATPVDKIDAISQALREAVLKFTGFNILITQLGAFPKPEYPRVVWVEITEGDKTLEELAGEIEERLLPLGFPKEERRFAAHITIARIRSSLNRIDLANKLKEAKPPLLSQKVDKITLFKSTLTPKGPVYEALKTINLKTI